MSKHCYYCKGTEEPLIDGYDGYGDSWYHSNCKQKSTEEFRAFLNNPENFKNKEQKQEERIKELEAELRSLKKQNSITARMNMYYAAQLAVVMETLELIKKGKSLIPKTINIIVQGKTPLTGMGIREARRLASETLKRKNPKTEALLEVIKAAKESSDLYAQLASEANVPGGEYTKIEGQWSLALEKQYEAVKKLEEIE